jgi:hypothetical protein
VGRNHKKRSFFTDNPIPELHPSARFITYRVVVPLLKLSNRFVLALNRIAPFPLLNYEFAESSP